MNTLVYDSQDELKGWAAVRVGVTKWPDDTRAIGVRDDNVLVAVILYNLFIDAGCSMHIATDRGRTWATRRTLTALFAYPFIQLGLRRVTAPIASKNRDATVMLVKLGFQFEGVMRHSRHDDDEVIMGLLRADCAWLPKEVHHG